MYRQPAVRSSFALNEMWRKKAGPKGPAKGRVPEIVTPEATKVYAWGDVVLPLAEGGQGVPGDGVIPGDELVLP